MHGGPDWEDFQRGFTSDIYVTEDERGFIDGIYFLTYPNEVMRTPLHEIQNAYDYFDFERFLWDRGIEAVSFVPRYDYIGWLGSVTYHFIISPEYIFYRDRNSLLAIPTNHVSAWALREGNLEEIFDHLALANRYFSGIIAPIFILLFVVFLFSQVALIVAAVWLFGWWQKTSGFLNWRARLAVCVFASVPAALISFALGLFFPLIHVFLFQFGMIYFAYKTLKEYFNEGSGYLAREVV